MTKKRQIKLLDSDKVFSIRVGQSVLDALTPGQNTTIPVGCCGGGCGVCKIKVISGSFTRGLMSKAHITDDEATSGYCLACRTYPQSDMVIAVIRRLPAKLEHRFGYLAKPQTVE